MALTEFEDKKTKYFYHLGLETREALKLHKSHGLWDRIPDDKDRKRDWGNVSEHCLVVLARCAVLSDLLNLSPAMKEYLSLAAVAHDFYKKYSKKATQTSDNPRADTLRTEKKSTEIASKSLPSEVIEILGILGDEKFTVAEKIVKRSNISEIDTAKLILRYVDDYTIGPGWVEPYDLKSGNNLDRRVDYNNSVPKYFENSEKWRDDLNGESLHEIQRRVGHLIEEKLTEIINTGRDNRMKPLLLPQFVDGIIKQRISEA